MKDFDIAKFLRENQLGSYGILNHYVDIKPLKEEEVTEDVTPEETAKVPYEGTQPRRDGFGDEFEQADPVSEDMDDSMKYPLTVFIDAVKAAKAAGVPKDRMLYFIDVFGEDIRENYEVGSEQDKLDTMITNSHPDIGSAADIISSTIKVLRNEKFSDQEIIDFLASLDSLDPSNF
jgi:hypothetical protein